MNDVWVERVTLKLYVVYGYIIVSLELERSYHAAIGNIRLLQFPKR